MITMAVLFLGLIAGGCVTKRDIEEVKSQIATVESQNRETLRMVARMDSVINAGAEASSALRGEMRFSLDEVTQQIAQLLENYNELVVLLDKMSSDKRLRKPPKSSVGAQTDQIVIQPEQPVDNDCDTLYDTSFLLTRQTEYQKAIDGFVVFLGKCPEHKNVENARYWIGECYYSLGKYPQAISEFDLLLKEFPASINSAGATYKMARALKELGKTEESRKLFQKLVDEQPNSFEGQQALKRLEELK